MKLLITTLSIVFISFGANAKFSTTGELYKDCKKFQTDGFQIKNQNDAMQIATSFSCLTRFLTMIEEGDILCMNLKLMHEKIGDKPWMKILAKRANSLVENVNQSIMAFINYAEKNPKKWNRWYQADRHEYFAKNFPCDYKKSL